MKKHELAFEKIRDVLRNHSRAHLTEHDESKKLLIGRSIWIECDELSWTIGYVGSVHDHYYEGVDDMCEAAQKLLNILTKRKRFTVFLKGNKMFKEKLEIEKDTEKYEVVATATSLFFPFWKRTAQKVSFEEPVLDMSVAANEIERIKQLYK